MKFDIAKNSSKILMVFLCLFSVVLFITITGFKDKENDRELIKDKIMTYMTAVKKGDVAGILEISGEKPDTDEAEETAKNVKEAIESLMKYEIRNFTIKKIDVQGAIAFVSLEEDVKITYSMPGMDPPESGDQSRADGFRTVTSEIVLIKRDGKWKIDAINTIQFSKIRDAFKNPEKLMEFQKTMSIGKFFTMLADPDISFIIVQTMSRFKTARGQGQVTACMSNMRNIGTALEMYSTDNEGHYPASLTQLTPDYLRIIPTCPAAEKQTYVDSYQVSQNPDAYSFYCKGDNHSIVGVPENYPSYNSTEGLNRGKEMKKGHIGTEPVAFSDKYQECCSNLKNIGTALEMYSTDYSGRYPVKLQQLVPEYLRSIPICPAAGKDTYSESYQMSKDGKSYSFCCKGHFHKSEGAPKDDPSYNSKTGLVKKKK